MNFIPFMALLACGSLYALVEAPIDEKRPIPVSFSTTSHNRISVEKGKVEKIFGDEAYFNVSVDRTTGNAFVSLTRPFLSPMTLTVVTGSGLIQDLEITSTDKSSEHLILKEENRELDELLFMTSQLHKPTIDLLNKILEGKIPQGYGQTPFPSNTPLSLPSPLLATQVEAFEGPFEHILVYKIKNTGKYPVVLSSDVLKTGPISWVFLNAHELKSKEEVLCILSTSKDGM